jgi:hypothetical protein
MPQPCRAGLLSPFTLHFCLTSNMSLSSRDRAAAHRSIEYTTISDRDVGETDQSHTVGEDLAMNTDESRTELATDSDVENGTIGYDAGACNATADAPNSKTAGRKIQGSNSLTNSEAAQYSGPDIKGWPTDPRKLKGFSVPTFLGDILLVLFPIAFLGIVDHSSSTRDSILTKMQYSESPPGGWMVKSYQRLDDWSNVL